MRIASGPSTSSSPPSGAHARARSCVVFPIEDHLIVQAKGARLESFTVGLRGVAVPDRDARQAPALGAHLVLSQPALDVIVHRRSP